MEMGLKRSKVSFKGFNQLPHSLAVNELRLAATASEPDHQLILPEVLLDSVGLPPPVQSANIYKQMTAIFFL